MTVPESNLNAQLFARARHAMPGGVSHELRYRRPNPMYITHARGPYKWDVDGRQIIDYKMGSASQMLGHTHPDVADAVIRQMSQTPFTADCHELEIVWAEKINQLFPCADLTRFTASGTEATMLAVRLGRAYSGRDKILRIDGHYHGWHDHLLKGSKPALRHAPSLGIPDSIELLTVVAPADLKVVQGLVEADPAIGTIIVEASGANYGAIPLPAGFLTGVRALASRLNIVLIFDEVITGLRWSPGGLQARDNIIPDLTSLAKVLTGGLPGGAVCGRADIMTLLDPGECVNGLSPPVSHKGTFNAAPMIAAGAVAALKHLETGGPQAHANAMATRLRDGLREIFERRNIPGAVYGESSTFHLFFGTCDGTVHTLEPATIRGISPDLVNGLRAGLIKRGVDLMSQTSGVTSWAHEETHVSLTLQAFDDTLKELITQGLIES